MAEPHDNGRPSKAVKTADLVAYLDGELDGAAAAAVERAMSADPAVRREAETLKRAWELLDHLPRTEPSPSFTSRTLERMEALAGRRSGSASLVPPTRSPWPRRLAWAAGLAAAFAGGYAGADLAVRRPPPPPVTPRDIDKLSLADARLYDNLPAYRHVDDLAFLEALDQPELFGDDRR